MNKNLSKTLIASAIGLALLGTDAANAALVTGVLGNGTWSTNHANFTNLTPTGATVGGANNVNMFWDGNAFTASSDYTGPGGASNVTTSTTTTFFNRLWTAHDIQMFLPGSYSFDTALGGGNPESGMMNVTVGAGQLGMHMMWDWKANNNIDMFVVFEQNSLFGTGVLRNAVNANNCDHYTEVASDAWISNCLWGGAAVTGYAPTANQMWMLASVDGNGDGIIGIPMAQGGPLGGFNTNFNANLDFTPTVPVPAAAWLFGSGLLGLLGISRRRKTVPVG